MYKPKFIAKQESGRINLTAKIRPCDFEQGFLLPKHTHTHIHKHTHSVTPTHSQSLSHTHTHTLSHTHTQSASLSLSVYLSVCLSLYLSLSLTHTHIICFMSVSTNELRHWILCSRCCHHRPRRLSPPPLLCQRGRIEDKRPRCTGHGFVLKMVITSCLCDFQVRHGRHSTSGSSSARPALAFTAA